MVDHLPRPALGSDQRVLHIVSEFSAHEAIGRTMVETATRVAGEHHLLAARVHDGTGPFATVTTVGGSLSGFTFERSADLRRAVDRLQPDLIHIHGGALAPFAALAPALRGRPSVHTIYAWPTLPGVSALRHASMRQLVSSNVVRARVALTTLVPTRGVRSALIRSGARVVLTPDPTVLERLGSRPELPVRHLSSGADTDDRRARRDDDRPVVVFAGRAEWVRGIGTLLDALPMLVRTVPTIRVRLLLLATPELQAILARIAALPASCAAAVDVQVGPVGDLRDELAAAQVGVWPFLFDYTTSPPAMALAEAMSVGLPVVSTPVACVRAVATDGENADLVAVGDAAGLAAAVTGLLTDPVRWRRRSLAGVQSVAHRHNWAAAAATTADAYTDALQPSSAATTRPVAA